MDENKRITDVEKEQIQETKREKIYESDLTPKEKRALEVEKLKTMTLWQKIEYIWAYYKIVFVAIISFAILIYIGVVIYHNAQQKELLSIAIVDAVYGPQTEKTELESDLLEFWSTGDKNETLTIDTNASSGNGYASVMKMNVVMSENGTDVLICNLDTYKEYEEQGAFKDWKEILGDDYAKYESYIEDGRVSLEASQKWNSYQLVSYSPAYVGLSASSDKDEEAKKLIQFFFGE